MFPWAFVLHVLLPSWAGPCLIVAFSFSNPSFAPFIGLLALLPYHFVIPAMLLYDPCLLDSFWACCKLSLCLILVAQYYHWASTHTILGFLDPFHCFWASLAHLILLGIPDPFPFLGHHRPILLPWAFAKSFGIPRPKLPYPLLLGFMGFPSYYLIHWFGPFWPILACFLFYIMPIGLLLLFFRLLLACLLSLRPIYYFLGLWSIISTIRA